MPTISQSQRDLHVWSEAAALVVVAPLLTYVAVTQRQLPPWQRWGLLGVAVGTLLIDGWLLTRWRR
jgi:hypothetical protein